MKPQSETDISHAVRVLTAESDALAQLARSIDQNFADAVSAIHAMKTAARGSGRLIVAGIGKSGHVARKIAATLASTGTPAYYVHPGEASHGDMGMITPKDVVLMLSNSGENVELSDLIHYSKRFDITLIALTGNPDSTLAKYADIKLIYPKVPEACPNGLAPTTSTTMMIALGDALAVALLERMGLTPEQYKVFHPGGKLGQRLMKVSELMVSGADLPLVPPESLMDRTLIVLTEKNLGVALVVNDAGGLLGLVTDGDLKRHMAPDLLQRSVTEIMTKNPKSISPDALAVEALDLMTKKKGRYLTTLVVMDGERLCGIIRLQDCLQAGIA
ncbi:MAG: KpsF/GutQ family sugar-phosphate isomerase [Alphaproteobacteria bacterium]|nr:KpsF/GutQ family sugar-phosphate isomerase [Alphaproteobacteria bacterium]QQS57348.1 MAG: KpsF/GutQ family sugar-phosphate isomerase [Alphaproteobacteria bacterium]